MKRLISPLVMALLFLAPQLCLAETKVWLIGGGNLLENSQGQIEENVRWLQQLFRERGIETHTYYTYGKGTADDVIYFAPESERDPLREPILRVYGNGLAYAKKTKPNSLLDVKGSTEKNQLIESLQQDFARVQAGDEVLLLYNGHGDTDPQDRLNNSLKLWGDTRLNIEELDSLLDKINPQATVRFVLTQCFSGSFASLIYDNPRSKQLASQARCGYLAESDRREAEGCDLGINQAEFRDYTTYFFAALSGKTRLGETIPLSETDLNGDGKVSYREAHLYTLKIADSSDLSRSSSEMLIEKAAPWYRRWESHQPTPDNDYGRIANAIAQRKNLPSQGPKLVLAWRQAANAEKELEAKQTAQAKIIRALQQQIANAIGHPRDQGTAILNNPGEALALLAQQIQAQPKYADLVAAQNAEATIDMELLNARRQTAQAERILRSRQLARQIQTPQGQALMNTAEACEAGNL